MKKFLMGLLVLGSVSAVASIETLEFCMKEGSSSGSEVLEIINKSYRHEDSNHSTRIVCAHGTYGNYLWDNSTGKSYRINLQDECMAIISSMEKNPRIAYEFEVGAFNVIKVTKSKTKMCDNVGNVTDQRTILDL